MAQERQVEERGTSDPLDNIIQKGTSSEIMANQHADSTRTEDKYKSLPCYNEEDILYWDIAIEKPPPRPSGTIHVKLKYKGRSKPIPVDDFWEE